MSKVKYIIRLTLAYIYVIPSIVLAAFVIAVVGISIAALRFFYMLMAMLVNVLVFFLNPLFGDEEKMRFISLDEKFRDYSRLMKYIAERITFPEEV